MGIEIIKILIAYIIMIIIFYNKSVAVKISEKPISIWNLVI